MANDRVELDRDESGNVLVRPVMGWDGWIMMQTNVLLAVEYSESPEDVSSGQGKRVQLLLTPQQSLELAEALTRWANQVLAPSSSEPN